MTNNDRVEEIANKVRDLELHLTAWKSLATQNCSGREIARLDRVVEDDVAQVRSADNYREHVDEFLKALRATGDDSGLIQTLHEEILYRANL